MKYVIFDSETNGLPADWKAPITDSANWPRMVQLAWGVYDENGKLLETHVYLVKPDGWVIPEELAEKLNGITTEMAECEGVGLATVLAVFFNSLTDDTTLVAHNISFDNKIIGAELVRLKSDTNLGLWTRLPKICTMMTSTKFCAIPGPRGPKWPKLEELYEKLFGDKISGAHHADVDTEATAKCFFELRKRQIIA